MFERFINVVECVSNSFLLLGSILLYEYVNMCLSIFPLKDIWVVSVWGYMDKSEMNILVQNVVWTYIFTTHGETAKSGIPRL